MAVVAIAFDGTRISDADAETNGGTWDKWGATQSPAQEGDFVYQGDYCMSNKISATTGGVDFDATTAVDYSTTARIALAKVNVTTYGLIDTTVHKGTAYQVGSGPGDYYEYYVHGSKRDYPFKGGWQILAIDPNEAAYRAATVGTPALGSVDYYGWWADITGTAKAENVMHDALEYLTTGDGLTLTGGDGASDDGVFQDFVDEDEGDSTKRWGVVTTVEGALVVTGWLNIGSSTATVFSDSGAVIFWTESMTGAGFNGIKADLSNATNDIQITDSFFRGSGRGFAKDIFHTQTDVDATNDVIILDTTKDWRDLDYVLYSNEGGTDTIGLTSGNHYWIAWDATNSGWAFYSTRDNAATDTTRVTLSDGTTGESHSMTKVPDGRPDLLVSGTTGVEATWTNCTFDNFRNMTLTSKGELNGCKLTNCEQLTQAGGTIDGCAISAATTDDGEAFIVSNGSTSNIKNSTFTFSNGHAIEITATGTYTLTNNTYTGYGGTPGSNLVAASGSTDAVIYNNSGGLITINVSGGSTPSVRNGSGATTIVINSKTISIHVENSGGGDISGAQVYVQKSPATAYTSDTGNNAGDADLVINESPDGDVPSTGWIRVWVKSLNETQTYRYASYTSKTFSLPTEVTFACTGGGTATLLQDSVNDFTALDIEEGDTVRNTTDGSWAVVDKITDASNITTTPLQGGTLNVWTSGDTYSFHKLATTLTDNDDIIDIPLLMGQTDGTGDITGDYAYTTDQAISVRIRLSSVAPKYIPYGTTGTITDTGYTLTAVISSDEVAI